MRRINQCLCLCVVVMALSESALAACDVEAQKIVSSRSGAYEMGEESSASDYTKDISDEVERLKNARPGSDAYKSLEVKATYAGSDYSDAYSRGHIQAMEDFKRCYAGVFASLKKDIDANSSSSRKAVKPETEKTGVASKTSKPAIETVGNYYSRTRFVDVHSSNSWEGKDSNGGKRKRIVLKNYARQCIQPVDIRMDKDVPGMYWYTMQNNCAQDLLVSWCDFAGGKPCVGVANSAWNIDAGKSYEAWSGVDPKSGRYHLRWWACQKEYQDQDVNFEDKTGECWVWGN